ncbi:hypothetical protein ACNSOL_00070 [Aliarcobacter lanthieri]|uniref:hypothetical protein n=1 Tax=Aliarcobacter lanthieri TaxID=1355374 RepID=UPI003AAEDDFE
MKGVDFLGFYNSHRLYEDMFNKTTQFLVLLDINEFYFVNYHYTEKMGNKILEQVGKKLKSISIYKIYIEVEINLFFCLKKKILQKKS